MSEYLLASVLLGFIFLSSIISIELGLAAAIIEILFGVLAGNVFHFQSTAWIDFLATFGGAYLTFLAGSEVDVPLMKKNWKEAALIGGVSFFAPLILCFMYAFYGTHWTFGASKIAAIALSTTSLAVVYAVLVETGLAATTLGKRIMAATFVTDILTVIALTFLFLHMNWYTLAFAIVSLLLILFLPTLFSKVLRRYNNKVVQPEIKLLFLVIFILEWLGTSGNNQPGLPIFILGLAMSGLLSKNPDLMKKMRLVGFSLITPFFFLKGGMNVELKYVTAALGVTLVFLALKLSSKFIAIFPLAKKYHTNHGTFTTLLMSTGLTFGTITSLYGLQHHIITERQFSILITVVIASAILPTLIALKFFAPTSKQMKDLALTEGAEG